MQDNVTLCMWYLNVNSKFHRFPIQYLESKPRFRSGQDQSPTPVSNEGSLLNTTPNPNQGLTSATSVSNEGSPLNTTPDSH